MFLSKFGLATLYIALVLMPKMGDKNAAALFTQ